jgi:hypothetical protein
MDTHKRWLDIQKAKTNYEGLCQITRAAYVGKVKGMESLSQRIMRLKQNTYNVKTGKMEYISVQELNKQYQMHLAEVDATNMLETAHLPSLSRTFFQALSTQLREKLVEHLPAAMHLDYNENLAFYNVFMQQAFKAEKEIKGVYNMVRNVATARTNTANWNRNPGAPRTFMATRGDERGHLGHSNGPSKFRECRVIEVDEDGEQVVMPEFCCYVATPGAPTEQKVKDEITQHAIVLVSVAEQALREASGMRVPMKCFGCQGLPAYDKNCLHQFKDCPNKKDPEVWKNFYKNLQTWREERGQRKQQANKWRQEGYPNKTTAEYVKQIANPDTPATTRRTLMAALGSQMTLLSVKDSDQDEEHGEQEATLTRNDKTKKKRKGTAGLTFLTYQLQQTEEQMERGFTFFSSDRQQFQYDIAATLPHLFLPIGRGDEDGSADAKLKGLLDSGGCCTMGHRPYFLLLKEKYPHLIKNHVHLEESKYENIRIGGLNGGIEITEMLEIWLPFADGDGNSSLTLGLSEDLPITTLFGLPFQIKAKLTIDLATPSAHSKVFRETFQMEMLKPERTPVKSLDYKPAANRVFLSDNPAITQIE